MLLCDPRRRPKRRPPGAARSPASLGHPARSVASPGSWAPVCPILRVLAAIVTGIPAVLISPGDLAPTHLPAPIPARCRTGRCSSLCRTWVKALPAGELPAFVADVISAARQREAPGAGESVLGATPREFESRILRATDDPGPSLGPGVVVVRRVMACTPSRSGLAVTSKTPEPAQLWVQGFSISEEITLAGWRRNSKPAGHSHGQRDSPKAVHAFCPGPCTLHKPTLEARSLSRTVRFWVRFWVRAGAVACRVKPGAVFAASWSKARLRYWQILTCSKLGAAGLPIGSDRCSRAQAELQSAADAIGAPAGSPVLHL